MVGRRGKGAPKLAQTRFKALTLTGLEELQDFHVIDVGVSADSRLQIRFYS